MPPPVTFPPLVLLGGSFDPVHQGHLWMAWAVQARLPTAELRFLPTAASPFKTGQTPARHRRAMLRLALRDTPFGLETLEIRQRQTCYTLDTLQAIRTRLGPDRPLIFVLGQDAFESLPRWKGGYALLELAHLWVFSRPAQGNRLALPASLQLRQADSPQSLLAQPAGLVWLDERIPPAISSTKIRQYLATSRPLLPPRVYRYTRQSDLYGKTHTHDC